MENIIKALNKGSVFFTTPAYYLLKISMLVRYIIRKSKQIGKSLKSQFN